MGDAAGGHVQPNGHGAATGQDEMPCPKLVELVTEYLEAALPEDEQARFDTHLALCPGCVVFLDQMRETVRTLGRVTPEPVPREVKDRLVAIYRDLRGGCSC